MKIRDDMAEIKEKNVDQGRYYRIKYRYRDNDTKLHIVPRHAALSNISTLRKSIKSFVSRNNNRDINFSTNS